MFYYKQKKEEYRNHIKFVHKSYECEFCEKKLILVRARLRGDIPEEFGLMLVSLWAHQGLMFEIFQGARLLLFACCFPFAGALSLMCPLLR